MVEYPIKCPQCSSDKIKFKCCGKRRCEACDYKWSVKRVPEPKQAPVQQKTEEQT